MIDRYSRQIMTDLWSKEYRFQKWLDLEILAIEAWAELGLVPREAAAALKEKAKFSLQRIEEIEEESCQEVEAFTQSVLENLGPESKYFHLGLTSTDLVDTALSALLQEALTVIQEGLEKLAEVLKKQAIKYKNTVCLGRTHGIQAKPTTFGLKLALWYSETRRNLERLEGAKERIAVGKISGAVGTYANVDPFVERYVCEGLNLQPALISTQTLQRDRHAELQMVLAIIASCLDKYAREIRALQKNEVIELDYQSNQKSSVPPKKSPISCQEISGLTRLVRSNSMAALENIANWHESDLSHSSVEKVILPDSTTLIDYLLNEFIPIVDDLRVYPENMLSNLEKNQGLLHSQQVISGLIAKDMPRETANQLVEKYTRLARDQSRSFKDLLQADEQISALLSPAELDDCFDLKHQLKHIDNIFARLGLIN